MQIGGDPNHTQDIKVQLVDALPPLKPYLWNLIYKLIAIRYDKY